MSTIADTTEASRALMARMYDSAIRGDFEDVMSCLDNDLVVNEPGFLPYGGVYRGAAAFAEMIPRVVELMDLQQMKVDRLVAEGDRVFGVIRMPDRATGEDVLLAEESLIREGRVVEINVFYNDARSLLTA